ncbi:MAG: N-acetylgalactosamine 6-sulfate sulfatase, partial [Massilibacteroides sp.]|nr:N-acetylgalactosamine 6-sulfate sulfatase [Massilibacteroides sp.]
RYGGKAYYAARYKDYKLLQNTPWEALQFFNIGKDPQEKQDITNKTSPEYLNLFDGMMEHIRVSGAIPWQNTNK